MKTVVFDRHVLEQEVKPHALLDRYRRLLAEDVMSRLAESDQLKSTGCPGCLSHGGSAAFEKLGMTYRQCETCRSLYVSPRPTEEVLVDFYRNSKSSLFWRERILPETRETRREKLFSPRAQWLLDVVDEYLPKAQMGVVVGYHNDLMIEELLRMEENLFKLLVTNPVADIECDHLKSENVVIRPMPESTLDAIGPSDIFLAFDILDRCVDTDVLFSAATKSLAPGGLFVGSTTLISGFDLQVLWDRSESIYPPDRMNLLSIEGLTALYERHGFEALEFSTPGMFDVEIVRRSIQGAPQDDWPRFIRYLVENRDEEALHSLQEYLQRYRLSSFGRIVLRAVGTS
ncbi:MAG: hypothetical protein JRG79_09795 [Deltaproteobacteria bacterium]|nr:hypothetical protein [Deltaproteobacteria bacterium]